MPVLGRGLLLLFIAVWSCTPARAALSPEDVTVDYREGHYFASFSMLVPIPASLALAVLTDFERMPAFLPNLSESRILEQRGNVFLIQQQGRAVFGPFVFPFSSERRVEVLPDGRLLSQSLPGAAQSLRSEMRFREQGGGTRFDYQVEVKPDRWLPSAIGVNFMRHELAEQFTAMSAEMLRRDLARKNGLPGRQANAH